MAMSPERLKNLIESGEYTRDKIFGMRNNCQKILSDESKSQAYKDQASELLKVINETEVPRLRADYIFMGYCPGGKVENSLKEDWISEDFCEFTFIESESQLDQFTEIVVGDIVILKIMDIPRQEMTLSAWGTVKGIGTRKQGTPYLKMDWHDKEDIIVPLMGCMRTVNIRPLKRVQDEMPNDFWEWLKD